MNKNRPGKSHDSSNTVQVVDVGMSGDSFVLKCIAVKVRMQVLLDVRLLSLYQLHLKD